MWVKFIILLVFLCFSGTKGLSKDGKPGYEYYPQIHGWLKMHQETVEWLEAKINCHNEDAVLLSPKTPEFVLMVNILQNASQLPAATREALTFSPYLPVWTVVARGPTILVDLERCVVFFANGTTGELSCKEKLPYVCYAPELVPTPATPGFLVTTGATIATGAPAAPEARTIPGVLATPSLFPPGCSLPKTIISTAPVVPTPAPVCEVEFSGYVYSNQTGHCYKFHNWTAGWRAANITCISEGAYLAIINSNTEAQFLKDLFEQYPPEKIEPGFKNWASIGFYLQSDTGVWITVDGQTLEQAGYAKWRLNEPTRDDVRI